MGKEPNHILTRGRLIRLSSPKLNYMIGAGAVILYIDVCFFVIPSTDQLSSTIYCDVWLCSSCIQVNSVLESEIATQFSLYRLHHGSLPLVTHSAMGQSSLKCSESSTSFAIYFQTIV